MTHSQESGPTLYALDHERGSAGGLQLVNIYL